MFFAQSLSLEYLKKRLSQWVTQLVIQRKIFDFDKINFTLIKALIFQLVFL